MPCQEGCAWQGRRTAWPYVSRRCTAKGLTCQHVIYQGKHVLHSLLFGDIAQDGEESLTVCWPILHIQDRS